MITDQIQSVSQCSASKCFLQSLDGLISFQILMVFYPHQFYTLYNHILYTYTNYSIVCLLEIFSPDLLGETYTLACLLLLVFWHVKHGQMLSYMYFRSFNLHTPNICRCIYHHLHIFLYYTHT